MKAFDRRDKLSLVAALGWLELGNPVEANPELENIAPELRAHPIVLRVRWCVYAAVGKWQMALTLARWLQRMEPKDFSGWILESETFDLMGQTHEAWKTLLVVANRFAEEPAIGYLLACYSAKLGYPLAAERWIKAAPGSRKFALLQVAVVRRAGFGDFLATY